MRTRNIVLLIIIIILVLFGILFLSDKISDSGLDNVNDCDELGSYFGKSIKKYNYCEVDDNCVVSWGICGYPLINKDGLNEIQKIGEKYSKLRCSAECNKMVPIVPRKLKCEDNKCVIGLPGFGDQRAILYLPNRVAEIKQGKKFGMGFGIQNVIKEQKFRWEINVNDADISRKCGVREQEAERWITTGRVGRAEIASGKSYYDFATFNIPEGSVSDISTCVIRYELVIREEDGGIYQVEFFDVDII